jgi:hypothetical protein
VLHFKEDDHIQEVIDSLSLLFNHIQLEDFSFASQALSYQLTTNLAYKRQSK